MVRKDRRILSFEYHIFVSPAKGPVAFATGPGVRLFAINLIVALDDGGNLSPGCGAAGDQVAVDALDQSLFHSPGHGGQGEVTDSFGVGVTGQGALGADIRALILGVPGQEGDQLFPGDGSVGGEGGPFLENNLNADGTVDIPEVLRPYMGGKEKLVPKK